VGDCPSDEGSAKVVGHESPFQMAAVATSKNLFAETQPIVPESWPPLVASTSAFSREPCAMTVPD
jgi:hypothetical protein